VPFAASLVIEEMKKMGAEPVSDQELNTSKRGFIERFPNNFATKAQIANTFAQDEFTGRYAKEPDFWKKYRTRIEKVGKEDIQRVAGRYLTPDKLAILVVGQKDEIMLGHPAHDVKLDQLTTGGVKQLPLRDPITMKPLPLSAKAPGGK
jgi:zinc protease